MCRLLNTVGGEVFLCYTHAPCEAMVSLTENIDIHAFGAELDGLCTFTTLRARYFRRTNSSLSWFLFLPKNCLLNGGGEVFPWRALMFSSLRLSACFIYDIRVWVIYCTLSWQWYIFETSSLSDRIGFIMFAVTNEKQCLSVAFLTGHFLQHPFTACFCYYTLPF